MEWAAAFGTPPDMRSRRGTTHDGANMLTKAIRPAAAITAAKSVHNNAWQL